mmetsp:Transcript_41532/g.81457  ORF Transcript_41532/g.81457 Transcript_41532/m.81457 type:complete len:418 (-) Transcript_41532:1833-3086(-)
MRLGFVVLGAASAVCAVLWIRSRSRASSSSSSLSMKPPTLQEKNGKDVSEPTSGAAGSKAQERPPEKKRLEVPDELKNRILGCVYGALIGDAVGVLAEGMTAAEATEKFGGLELSLDGTFVDNHTAKFVNKWTEDGDKFLLAVRVILDAERRGLAHIPATDFTHALRGWLSDGLPTLPIASRVPGKDVSTSDMLTQLLLTDSDNCSQDAEEIATKLREQRKKEGYVTAGNEGLALALVLGLRPAACVEDTATAASALARAVYGRDSQAVAAMVMLSVSVSLLLCMPDAHTSAVVKLALEITANEVADIAALEGLRRHVLCAGLEELEIDQDDKTTHSFKAVGAAFYCLLHHRKEVAAGASDLAAARQDDMQEIELLDHYHHHYHRTLSAGQEREQEQQQQQQQQWSGWYGALLFGAV